MNQRFIALAILATAVLSFAYAATNSTLIPVVTYVPINGTSLSLQQVGGFVPKNITRSVRAPTLHESCAAWSANSSSNSSTSGSGAQKRSIIDKDDRYSYNSTAYPYSTFGIIGTSNDTLCSATMVGKNLILTASSCINWELFEKNNLTIVYVPQYYEGDEPFGRAFVKHAYFIKQVGNGLINSSDSAFDYAVLQIDQDIGNITGWAGAKIYQNTSDGEDNYWASGYPVTCFKANRPVITFNATILDSIVYKSGNDTGLYLRTLSDVTAGEAGQSLFAYFEGEKYISVVGVVSASTSEFNVAGGGAALVKLISVAREQAKLNP